MNGEGRFQGSQKLVDKPIGGDWSISKGTTMYGIFAPTH